MSKWRYGCGKPVTQYVPTYSHYREVPGECGQTAFDGSVLQCESCEVEHPVDVPNEDEDDMAWFERQEEE